MANGLEQLISKAVEMWDSAVQWRRSEWPATSVGLHFLRFRKACAFDVRITLRETKIVKFQVGICKAGKGSCWVRNSLDIICPSPLSVPS